jgi:hypothetical protein
MVTENIGSQRGTGQIVFCILYYIITTVRIL